MLVALEEFRGEVAREGLFPSFTAVPATLARSGGGLQALACRSSTFSSAIVSHLLGSVYCPMYVSERINVSAKAFERRFDARSKRNG